MNYNEIKKAYTDIKTVCEKYVTSDFMANSDFSDIKDMKEKAENHLTLIDWFEKYGLEIRHTTRINGYNYFKIDDYRAFSYYSNAKEEKIKGSGKYISCEDDNKQPNNEWLLSICFSTGAYIFGDDYPVSLFQEFWQELKSYEPKYCDTSSHNLYFSLENSEKIFSEFNGIYKKYQEKNREEFKIRKIAKLKKELEQLEQ